MWERPWHAPMFGDYLVTDDLNEVLERWSVPSSKFTWFNESQDTVFWFTDKNIISYDIATKKRMQHSLPIEMGNSFVNSYAVIDGDSLTITRDSATGTLSLFRGLVKPEFLDSMSRNGSLYTEIIKHRNGSYGIVEYTPATSNDSVEINFNGPGDSTYTYTVIKDGYGALKLAAHYGNVAFVYESPTDDSAWNLDVYNVDEHRVVNQRTFYRSESLSWTFDVNLNYISDGKYLLFQADSLWLLDPNTLEVITSVTAEYGRLENPVVYDKWILGTDEVILRWNPLGMPLSVDQVDSSPSTPSSFIPTRFRLYSITGELLSESVHSRIPLSTLATGPYIVVSIEDESGRVEVEKVMVVR